MLVENDCSIGNGTGVENWDSVCLDCLGANADRISKKPVYCVYLPQFLHPGH